MLNTIAKIKSEHYTKELKKAFAQQSQSIQRMHEGIKHIEMNPYGTAGNVWSQEEFITRIKDHEQQVNQIVYMDRMNMVQGGSIG